MKKGLDSVYDIHFHSTPKFLKKKARRPSSPSAIQVGKQCFQSQQEL